VAEGMRRCALLGVQQVILAPYLLFTGDVDQDIRRSAEGMARDLGLRLIQASYLGVHPLVVEVAQQRLVEALNGAAAMNCDLCKYRFPLPGYADQVGRPQTTRHLYGGMAHAHDHDEASDHVH
ncbi:MAG: CbiX/SirB N-terminal domain-containing protein, partial [Anaerolineae bacterium]